MLKTTKSFEDLVINHNITEYVSASIAKLRYEGEIRLEDSLYAAEKALVSEAIKSICNSLLNNNGLIANIEIKFNLMTIDFDSRLDDINLLGVRLHGDCFGGYVLTTKEFNLCNGFDHTLLEEVENSLNILYTYFKDRHLDNSSLIIRSLKDNVVKNLKHCTNLNEYVNIYNDVLDEEDANDTSYIKYCVVLKDVCSVTLPSV